MRVIIVTGLSGAGKSTALRALEDLAFFCVDNLPLPMLTGFVATMSEENVSRVAVSVDARQPMFLDQYQQKVEELRQQGYDVDTLFLQAQDEVLIRRYSETRRTHPLSGANVVEGVVRERELLAPLREGATLLDSGSLNVHQLKGIIQERYGRVDDHLAVTLVSFGFKHGVPPESDLVFDVRFLPNPYFEESLSARNGRDEEVAEFVLGTEDGLETLTRVKDYISFSLPKFDNEGKKYLTVAVGCTGGRHRSVAMVEALAGDLGQDWDVVVRHRDLGLEG
jgi:UPF0042 nucleotide-binding protein